MVGGVEEAGGEAAEAEVLPEVARGEEGEAEEVVEKVGRMVFCADGLACRHIYGVGVMRYPSAERPGLASKFPQDMLRGKGY